MHRQLGYFSHVCDRLFSPHHILFGPMVRSFFGSFETPFTQRLSFFLLTQLSNARKSLLEYSLCTFSLELFFVSTLLLVHLETVALKWTLPHYLWHRVSMVMKFCLCNFKRHRKTLLCTSNGLSYLRHIPNAEQKSEPTISYVPD